MPAQGKIFGVLFGVKFLKNDGKYGHRNVHIGKYRTSCTNQSESRCNGSLQIFNTEQDWVGIICAMLFI